MKSIILFLLNQPKRISLIFIFLSSSFYLVSQETDLKRGLVAYYPFNGNFNDASVNKNNGTVNGVELTGDKLGKPNSAAYFDGKSYIVVPDNNSLDFSTSFSVFAWVNFDDANQNQKIISKIDLNSMDGGYIFGIDKGKLYPEVFDKWKKKYGGLKGETIQSGEWCLIGMIYDKDRIKYFINGKMVTDVQFMATSLDNNSSKLVIGTNSWENPPTNLMTRGKIDELRIYNRPLNTKEIQALLAMMSETPGMAPVISWENPTSLYAVSTQEYFTLKACIKSSKPLTDLQVYINNVLVTDKGGRGYNVVQSGKCDVVFEQSVYLVDGENRIKIVAINPEGSTISNELTISYQASGQDTEGPAITIIQPQVQRGFKMAEENNKLSITGKATDASGIYNIKVNGASINFGQDGIFRATVDLYYGENTITVQAVDKKQNTSEYTFFVNRKTNKVVENNLPDNSTEKRYALVIGNAAYSSAPLKNPVNDANLMTGELAKLGFEVTTVTNGSQKEMKQAISKFGDLLASDKNAIGLFFYAGHGIQAKGKNYIVPTDAQIEKEADLVVYCVDMDELLANMEYAGNNLNMIILDACRNNPFGRGFRSQAGTGLATINAPSGTIIAFATAPGSVAADGDGNNGLYTQEFVKALQTPNIKIEDLFKRVRTQVKSISGGKQIPWENSALEGDFYFKKEM
ncbi:MAG: caspase family protein [Bacteroidales bacterium]